MYEYKWVYSLTSIRNREWSFMQEFMFPLQDQRWGGGPWIIDASGEAVDH